MSKNPESIKILKVRFDKVTMDEALALIFQWLGENKQRYLATPNPEIILQAQKNEKFLEVLNNSSLNVPDGTGILWAAKHTDKTQDKKGNILKTLYWLYSLMLIPFYPGHRKSVLKQRVTGVDLMEKICERTEETGHRIFLLGAQEGVAEKTRGILEGKYPRINIVGTYAGAPDEKYENEIIEKVSAVTPDIIFVAYGAPFQEMWISRNLKKIPTVKIAMGVGGAFDFIAGTKKRAPVFMQKTGTEWLYRLIQQPSRIKRIYNATIKFPIKILKKSLDK